MTQQRNLGEALSAALETGPSRNALAAQRSQILAALAQPAPAKRPYVAVASGGAVLAVAAALLLWLPGRETTELRGAWQGKSLPERRRRPVG